ncbi:uncharacterized protein LOC119078537 [Bradysia coprophila]|uniref:uncharacterized protein LOC119078537 n=1 Tax=Bradysia coprophila TaxID=38358 RepID=UPI00187D7A14|nr:uncharacterized protein LOC119078537 [Bradysia coprophila]
MHFLTKEFVRLIQLQLLLYINVLTIAQPSVEINCTYAHKMLGIQSVILGIFYECFSNETINVSERNTAVTNVTGMHLHTLNNSNVQGIHIIGASYLPTGLAKFFPNLIGLSVEQHLKEITKNDLEPFPNLIHLWLVRNPLEVIEKDLFMYNPDLAYISLRQNFIKEIDSNVFDHLDRLSILELDRNECINDNAAGRYDVMRLIKQIKEKCVVEQTTETTGPVTAPAKMKITQQELLNEKEILTGKVHFWKIFSIVLLLIAVFVTIVVMGVFIQRHGGHSVMKFVLFRNS